MTHVKKKLAMYYVISFAFYETITRMTQPATGTYFKVKDPSAGLALRLSE